MISSSAMRRPPCSLIPGFLLLLTVTFPLSSAAQVPVEVNTCGQVVSGDGFLAADLDCTGFTGGLLGYGAAVILSRRATLDLRGFTLRGGEYGVICAKPCGGASNALCSVPSCKIRGGGGTIAGATKIGILSERVVLDDVTVRDHGYTGITTVDGEVRLVNSLVTGNEIGIATNRYVLLFNSSVAGNTQTDVTATHGVRLRGSSTVGP
jgi:hypothetical protein